MQDSVVRTRVNASEWESDLYSSVSSANMWWETNYIRRRLSIQNKKNWSQDRALGDPTSQKGRGGFYFIYIYCLYPTLQVKIKEQQIKITDTESVFEASQIDSVEGRAWIQKSQNGDRARAWSSQEVIKNTKESCLSTVFWAISWLEGVPKIVLIKMTKKLTKKKKFNTFGHKRLIWNRPKVYSLFFIEHLAQERSFSKEVWPWLLSYRKEKCRSTRTGLQWQWAEEQSR